MEYGNNINVYYFFWPQCLVLPRVWYLKADYIKIQSNLSEKQTTLAENDQT